MVDWPHVEPDQKRKKDMEPYSIHSYIIQEVGGFEFYETENGMNWIEKYLARDSKPNFHATKEVSSGMMDHHIEERIGKPRRMTISGTQGRQVKRHTWEDQRRFKENWKYETQHVCWSSGSECVHDRNLEAHRRQSDHGRCWYLQYQKWRKTENSRERQRNGLSWI